MVRFMERFRCLDSRGDSGDDFKEEASYVKTIESTKSRDTYCASTLYSSSSTRSVHWGENHVVQLSEEVDEREYFPSEYIDGFSSEDERADFDEYSETAVPKREMYWYELPTVSTDSTTVSAMSHPTQSRQRRITPEESITKKHLQIKEFDEFYNESNNQRDEHDGQHGFEYFDKPPTRRYQARKSRTIHNQAQSKAAYSADHCKLLYNLSRDKQEEGRRRREAIAEASHKRNRRPKPGDFGMISASKATDLYKRGMRSLREKSLRITEEQKKKIETEASTHEFKLARGAFACTPAPSLSMADGSRSDLSLSGKKLPTGNRRGEDDYKLSGDHASPRRKRLPLSRANDMYAKSVKRIHAKNKMVVNNTINDGRERKIEKIPLSRATDMYERSMKLAYKKQLKLAAQKSSRADETVEKTRSRGVSKKKISQSRAFQMHKKAPTSTDCKSKKTAPANNKKITLEKSKKSTSIREFGTIPKSRVAYMHEKGKRSLEAKHKKLEELRRQQEFEKSLLVKSTHHKRNKSSKKALQLIHTRREEGTGIQNIEVRITDFDFEEF